MDLYRSRLDSLMDKLQLNITEFTEDITSEELDTTQILLRLIDHQRQMIGSLAETIGELEAIIQDVIEHVGMETVTNPTVTVKLPLVAETQSDN